MSDELAHLRDWIGRGETAEATVDGRLVDGLNATFDHDVAPARPGDEVPPGWQMLFFPEAVRLSQTDPDGHPSRGGFLPPVPLPRRMWAGDRMVFDRALRVGERLTRRSTIAEVSVKQGASGPLVIVTVHHDLAGADGPVAAEDHDIVYRAAASPGETRPAARPPPAGARPHIRQEPAAPAAANWRRVIRPSPVLLFRFSALTMNSHRIHYDRDYATRIEGYPGLLVHGPLTALLLLDLLRREHPAARVARFAARAIAPLYDTADFTVEGTLAEDGTSALLWALDPAGGLAMSATADLR